MTHKLSVWVGIVGVALMLIALSLLYNFRPVSASAYPGLQARIATTTPLAVGPGSGMVEIAFATSSCASRVITTVASPIMMQFTLAFGSSTLPNGTEGHLQAASTTSVYDSGLYGCDALTIYSFASSTITISESR